MIDRIIVAILTRLGAWLYARILERVNAQIQEAADKKAVEARIDAETEKVKHAYSEAFNGTPVTKEQRKALNASVVEFLRGPDGNGL